MLAAAWVTAIATGLLAVFAVVTAIFAIKAFGEQTQEVRDQAVLLQVQSGQLEAMRGQLAEMRKVSEAQLEVLELQAKELQASLAGREREAAERHRAQAARVYITEEPFKGRSKERAVRAANAGLAGLGPRLPSVKATVHNTSAQPVYDAELRWNIGPGPHGGPEPLGVIMPGDTVSKSREFPEGTNFKVSGASLRFTDASGTRWLRRADGFLREEPQR